jgi:hypothetical protein
MTHKGDRSTSVFQAIADPDRVGWVCSRCPQSNPLHRGLLKCEGCDFPLDQAWVRGALAVRRERLSA